MHSCVCVCVSVCVCLIPCLHDGGLAGPAADRMDGFEHRALGALGAPDCGVEALLLRAERLVRAGRQVQLVLTERRKPRIGVRLKTITRFDFPDFTFKRTLCLLMLSLYKSWRERIDIADDADSKRTENPLRS